MHIQQTDGKLYAASVLLPQMSYVKSGLYPLPCVRSSNRKYGLDLGLSEDGGRFKCPKYCLKLKKKMDSLHKARFLLLFYWMII